MNDRQIIQSLSDDELTTSLSELIRMSKGIMPENVRLMTIEVIERFKKKCCLLN